MAESERERIQREKQAIIAEYGDLFHQVAAILFRHVPVGINMEENTDEYEPEVGTIRPQCVHCERCENCRLMTTPPPWFVPQLHETIAWCLPRVRVDEPKECLRSEALAPAPNDYSHELLVPRTISGVVARRRRKLGQLAAEAPAELVRGGRLLLSDYDVTLCDGACEHGSNGYFDSHDVPPWDTWVGELSSAKGEQSSGKANLLIAWVPREFVPLVDRGIEEDPYGMLGWADEGFLIDFDTTWLATFIAESRRGS